MHCNQLESIDNYKTKISTVSSFISVAMVKYTDNACFGGERIHLSLQVLVTSQPGVGVAGL